MSNSTRAAGEDTTNSNNSQQRQLHHRSVRVDGKVSPRSAPMFLALSTRSFVMRILLPLTFLALAGCTIETPAPVHTTYVTPAPTTTYVTPAPTTTYVAPAAPVATVIQ
jgi:hypothetical protein